MKKIILLLLAITSNSILNAQAQEVMAEVDSFALVKEMMEAMFDYKRDTTIALAKGDGSIIVPAGFKFLESEQAQYVLEDLWGNPPNEDILGLLIPENLGVTDSNAWIFSISYDDIGYVEDDDAQDIKYDDLLKDMQQEINEANEERNANGYGNLTLVGWAAKPYYDKSKRVLHWAKELKFGDDNINTLNYNLRILGRKGVYVANAVADMVNLPDVEKSIPSMIGSVQFNDGSKYLDFDPKIDKVAAWTIGGLVAGKVLAKAGFLVLFLKFGKLLLIPFLFFWKYIKNFFTRGKKEDNQVTDNLKSDHFNLENSENTSISENNDHRINEGDSTMPSDKNTDY